MNKIYIYLLIFFLPTVIYSATTFNNQGDFFETNQTSGNDANAGTDLNSNITDDELGPTVPLNNTNDFNLGNTNLTNQIGNQNLNNSFNNSNNNSNNVEESLQSVLKRCGENPGVCGFKELIEVVNALLKWAMVGLASTATIMFIYGGFLYMSAQGDTNQVKRAHGIFRVVLVGFVIILLSYLLVQEFLKYFLDPSKSGIYKLLNNN